MQGEPREPVHPDPADAAGAVLQPAPAATVLGLVLETASVKVPELVLVKVLVLNWARGPLQRQEPRPVVPSGGHRPHGPKPELRLLAQWLQELESAPALLKRKHLFHHPSVPAMARGLAPAPASEAPQPVVETS